MGFIFQRVIRNRNLGWWMQYNYITSAALDSGLTISTLIIFFTLTLTNTAAPSWWGNNVVTTTLDYKDLAIRKVATEPFGPKSW